MSARADIGLGVGNTRGIYVCILWGDTLESGFVRKLRPCPGMAAVHMLWAVVGWDKLKSGVMESGTADCLETS